MRELKNNYPIFSERLITAMRNKGIKSVKLASSLGVTTGVISNYRHGYFKPKDDRLQELADVLNVSPEWLDGYDVPMEKQTYNDNIHAVTGPMRTLNVLSAISCGCGVFNDGEVVETLQLPAAMFVASREYFAMYAEGDSMIDAGISDGDLLIFERTDVPEQNKVGAFCVANEFALCKRYQTNQGKIFLLSANEKYPPIVIEPTDECFRCVGILKRILKEFN